MKIFRESGWQFQFDPDWRVLPFDQHRFYRYVSGYGLKGVDFLIWEEAKNQLLLMEVKNFAPPDWPGPSPSMEYVLQKPEAYAQEMIQKFTDSIQLLQIINQYYHRKWWYRLYLLSFDKYLPKTWKNLFPFHIWEKAYRLVLEKPAQVQLILFLELAENVTQATEAAFFKTLQEQMETPLSQLGFSFFLVNRQNPFDGIEVIDKE